MKDEKSVMVSDVEIPFSRMVVISSKWVFAAFPAVLVAKFGLAWLMIQIAN